MEMRAGEEDDIDIGQDLTPPLSPLAFSLYNSSLLSHCSSCSSPLPPNPHPHHHLPSLLYCSLKCSSTSNPHLSAAEHHLLHTHPHHLSDTSDLRASLRLLYRFDADISGFGGFPARIRGLLTNREKLIGIAGNDGVKERIKDGGKAIAVARRMSEGLDLDGGEGNCVVEEAVLCAVLTNAVEVQVKGGGSIGIAVYGTDFSWINHSCSPNACYRFLPPEFSGGESRLRITPVATAGGGGIELVDNECKGYGPRVVVRSIKAIKKGEEVSIAYTDLLQPKALRQSELWLKYRFICCCRRCSALPPCYVDLVLQLIVNTYGSFFVQEESVVNLDSTNPSYDQNFYREKEIEKLTDHIEDAISDYLSFNNAESCCEKLENALTHGLLKEENLQQKIRLHPLHHLSLNTCTTLASAYKVRGTELLDLNPESDNDEDYMRAFDMNRISSAYSFLLAGATHHLFLSESSLIASTANYWTYAGESLINLARSTIWNFVLKRQSPVTDFSPFQSPKSCDCVLMAMFEADFVSSQSRNTEFEDISREFLHCIKNITPNVWSFLVSSNCYLRTIKDPLDFSWLGTKKSVNISELLKGNLDSSKEEGFADQERMDIFRLGVHCLLYGGFLSRICWGKDSYLTCSIQSVLNGGRT
ncbi:hypothetical protein LguiA_018363 [Lonicera macranthoides]